MEKDELAILFANQKSEEIASIIKEAYIKGYEQGCLDSNKSINIDCVEYVDLGLPSGTLWSSIPLDYLNYGYKQRLLSYQEALKLQIPTVDQWEEICQFCKFVQDKIIGPSGQRIGYGWAPSGYRIYNLGEGCTENKQMFWLKGDVDDDNTAPTFIYDIKREDEVEFVFSHTTGMARHFTGFKLPVFLVRNKS